MSQNMITHRIIKTVQESTSQSKLFNSDQHLCRNTQHRHTAELPKDEVKETCNIFHLSVREVCLKRIFLLPFSIINECVAFNWFTLFSLHTKKLQNNQRWTHSQWPMSDTLWLWSVCQNHTLWLELFWQPSSTTTRANNFCIRWSFLLLALQGR